MYLFFLFPLLYIVWLEILGIEWRKKIAEEKTLNYTTLISVVVAVRNEETQIDSLVNILIKQNYPASLVEIIFVDDHSTDNTISKLKNYNEIVVLQNIGEGKKNAITTALNHSQAELIVTTDADCEMGPNWLSTLVDLYIQKNAAMVCGPVKLKKNKTNSAFLYQLQTFEFHSLIEMSAAYIKRKQPFTCNGANLAYKRSLFFEVGGYHDNKNIASGDDEFLMHKLANKGPIVFAQNKDAIVTTQSVSTFTQYFEQRIRWASKHKLYKKHYQITALYLVAINHLVSMGAIVLMLSGYNTIYMLLFFLVKTFFEFRYIHNIHQFYQLPISIIYLLLFQFVYPFIVTYIAIRSNFYGYEWKGRKIINQ
jgi:cellulose synthase/poly-beta-1,6-N-acetylglucosamine synthase-like glycosyltransferase